MYINQLTINQSIYQLVKNQIFDALSELNLDVGVIQIFNIYLEIIEI